MTAYVYAGVKELIIPFCTWNGIIDIGLHLTVYAFVSSIIFFTLAAQTESNNIERQVRHISDDLNSDVFRVSSVPVKDWIVVSPHRNIDCEAAQGLRTNSLIWSGCAVGALFVLLFVCWVLQYWKTAPSWIKHITLNSSTLAHILVSNTLLIIFVVMAEYSFQKLVLSNLNEVDSVVAKRYVLEALLMKYNHARLLRKC